MSTKKEKTAEVQLINSNGSVSKKIAIELMRAKPGTELGNDVYGGVLTSKNGEYMGVFHATERNRERIEEIYFQFYDC